MNDSVLLNELEFPPKSESKDFRVLFLYPNLMMVNLIPVSVSILSAVLKQNGFQIRVFDTTFYPTEEVGREKRRVENLQLRDFDYEEYGVSFKTTDMFEDLRHTVEDYKPNLIAVSVVEDTWRMGLALLDSIKHYRIPTIVGGIYAIFSPEDVISQDSVDIVCLGEGEGALVELCNKMYRGEDITKIGSLWVKQNGTVYKNPFRPQPQLDQLPFMDFSIYEKERFHRPMQGKIYRMAPIEIYRGCPYKCTYCEAPSLAEKYAAGGTGRYYRARDMKRTIAEIKYQSEKYGLQYIYFTAETFLALSPQDFYDFARLYRDIRLPFWIQTRPETISKEKVRILEEIGCDRVTMAIESGNEYLRRKLLLRNISNEDLVKAFENFEGSNIKVSVNNMLGFPDETREEIFDTIELVRRIRHYVDSISAFIFTPYKGTPLYELSKKKGYFNDDVPGVKDSTGGSLLTMPQITKEELRGLLRTFVLYCTFPKDEWPTIRRAEKFDDEGNRIFAELRRLFVSKYFERTPPEFTQINTYGVPQVQTLQNPSVY